MICLLLLLLLLLRVRWVDVEVGDSAIAGIELLLKLAGLLLLLSTESCLLCSVYSLLLSFTG